MANTKCVHEPDPRTAQPAQGREVGFIIDFSCKKCGSSGSTRVDPRDVSFDEE